MSLKENSVKKIVCLTLFLHSISFAAQCHKPNMPLCLQTAEKFKNNTEFKICKLQLNQYLSSNINYSLCLFGKTDASFDVRLEMMETANNSELATKIFNCKAGGKCE